MSRKQSQTKFTKLNNTSQILDYFYIRSDFIILLWFVIYFRTTQWMLTAGLAVCFVCVPDVRRAGVVFGFIVQTKHPGDY